MWELWSKIYFIKTVFENFMKWGLKGGISIDANYGPLRYVLWPCGSICHQLFTFIQIYSGHTVNCYHSRQKKITSLSTYAVCNQLSKQNISSNLRQIVKNGPSVNIWPKPIIIFFSRVVSYCLDLVTGKNYRLASSCWWVETKYVSNFLSPN